MCVAPRRGWGAYTIQTPWGRSGGHGVLRSKLLSPATGNGPRQPTYPATPETEKEACCGQHNFSGRGAAGLLSCQGKGVGGASSHAGSRSLGCQGGRVMGKPAWESLGRASPELNCGQPPRLCVTAGEVFTDKSASRVLVAGGYLAGGGGRCAPANMQGQPVCAQMTTFGAGGNHTKVRTSPWDKR